MYPRTPATACSRNAIDRPAVSVQGNIVNYRELARLSTDRTAATAAERRTERSVECCDVPQSLTHVSGRSEASPAPRRRKPASPFRPTSRSRYSVITSAKGVMFSSALVIVFCLFVTRITQKTTHKIDFHNIRWKGGRLTVE